MNTNDLYLEYARVIEMCKGTELEDTPWVCVKLDGEALRDNYGHPGLSASIEKYEFAAAVLEGRPVFVGDTVYYKCDGEKLEIIDYGIGGEIIVKYLSDAEISIKFLPENFTWTPHTPTTPRRTFTLNDVDLPCPVRADEFASGVIILGGEPFYFNSIEEAHSVECQLITLLTEARDKP